MIATRDNSNVGAGNYTSTRIFKVMREHSVGENRSKRKKTPDKNVPQKFWGPLIAILITVISGIFVFLFTFSLQNLRDDHRDIRDNFQYLRDDFQYLRNKLDLVEKSVFDLSSSLKVLETRTQIMFDRLLSFHEREIEQRAQKLGKNGRQGKGGKMLGTIKLPASFLAQLDSIASTIQGKPASDRLLLSLIMQHSSSSATLAIARQNGFDDDAPILIAARSYLKSKLQNNANNSTVSGTSPSANSATNLARKNR